MATLGLMVDSDEIIDGNVVKLCKGFSILANEAVFLRLFNLSHGETTIRLDEMFTLDGVYRLIISDLNENVATIYLRVDTTPPTVNLNATLSSDNIDIELDEGDCKEVFLSKDGQSIDFKNHITEHGKYKLVVKDVIGNSAEVAFEIDKKVEYRKNIENNAFTNTVVRISNLEEGAKVVLNRNGEDVEFTSVISEDGKYILYLEDAIGNNEHLTFTIKKRSIGTSTMLTYVDGMVASLAGRNVDLVITDGKVTFNEDGHYEIKYGANTFVFTIDNILPSIVIEGENKSKTKVIIYDENDTVYDIFLNGKRVTNATGVISKPGKYKIVATDEAGNVSELEFDKKYTMNASTIILLSFIMLLLFGVVIVILYKRKNISFAKVKKIKKPSHAETKKED